MALPGKLKRWNKHLESGFWHYALHVDSRGLWRDSALSKPAARDIIRKYEAPIRCQDILSRLKRYPEKYPQRGSREPWDGVVLAGQMSRDSSIRTVTAKGTRRYWEFVERAVKHYGKRLLIKMHPMSQEQDIWNHTKLARDAGATCEMRDLDCLNGCEFVVVYNSTFAVDALMRGKNVLQYAPGYFSGTEAVTFSDGRFDVEVQDRREAGQKLVDFLMWRYCWYRHMPDSWKEEMKRCYNESRDLFPLPERLSYGGYYRHCCETGDDALFDLAKEEAS
jgi:capsule polysaccharide export protein KpsC/LpsZ